MKPMSKSLPRISRPAAALPNKCNCMSIGNCASVDVDDVDDADEVTLEMPVLQQVEEVEGKGIECC